MENGSLPLEVKALKSSEIVDAENISDENFTTTSAQAFQMEGIINAFSGNHSIDRNDIQAAIICFGATEKTNYHYIISDFSPAFSFTTMEFTAAYFLYARALNVLTSGTSAIRGAILADKLSAIMPSAYILFAERVRPTYFERSH